MIIVAVVAVVVTDDGFNNFRRSLTRTNGVVGVARYMDHIAIIA